MRLIDADRLKSYIDCGHLRPPTEVCFSEFDVCSMIDKAPTIEPSEQVTVKLESVEIPTVADDKSTISQPKSKLDLISRADALEAVKGIFTTDGCIYKNLSEINTHGHIVEAINALPSADRPSMIPIKLEKRYPQSKDEDITDAFMRGYMQGKSADRPIQVQEIKPKDGFKIDDVPDDWTPRILGNIEVVVRCKDCKHRVFTKDGESNPHDIVCDFHMSDGFDETDFCSYGEREE